MADRYAEDKDRSPLTWWKGHPIYAATLLVILHVASMILFSLLSGANLHRFIMELIFRSDAVLHQGHVWQVVTYAFMNPPNIWFAIEMLLLYSFGRNLEVFFGRRNFLRAYLILLLSAPILLLLIGLVTPTHFAGSSALHFSLFVAFATLYPGAMLIGGIPARWVAFVLLGINSLQALAYRDFTSLLVLWETAAVAYALVRWEQGRWSLPRLGFLKPKPKLRVLPRDGERDRPKRVATKPTDSSSDIMDRLLDKIAASGIQSLTDKERAQLEKARQDLLEEDR